jgi:hypothetical protein
MRMLIIPARRYNVYKVHLPWGFTGAFTFAYEAFVLFRRSILIVLAHALNTERPIALAWVSVINICVLMVHLIARFALNHDFRLPFLTFRIGLHFGAAHI